MANRNKNKAVIGALLVSLYFFNYAHAEGLTVGDIAKGLLSPLLGVGSLFVTFSYLSGLVLGVMAALKLKEYSDSKGQSKFSTCVLYIIGSALFIALPSTVSVGKQIMGVEDSEGIQEAVGIKDGSGVSSDTSGGNSEF